MRIEDTFRRMLLLHMLPGKMLTEQELRECAAGPYPEILRYEFFQREYGMLPRDVDANPEYASALMDVHLAREEAQQRIEDYVRTNGE